MRDGSVYEKWTIPRVRTRSQGRLRLLLFPFAGGAPAAFAEWQSYFPEVIETYAVQYPGRGNRWNEPRYATLSETVTAIVDELVPHLRPPFAFLGHSMGGLVAFEVARLIARRGGELPVHLFVAGAVPPGMPRGRKLHSLTDREFLAELRGFGGLAPAVVENDELLKLLLPVIRDDFRLSEEHEPTAGARLRVPITVFGGLHDRKAPPEMLRAWASHTIESFQAHFLPGEHFFLFEHGREVAERIWNELQPVLAEPEFRTCAH